LVRNLSAFSTLLAPGKSWDNVRSTAAPYTESRLARLVRNKRVGFLVLEHTLTMIFVLAIMLPKVSKVKERGYKLNI